MKRVPLPGVGQEPATMRRLCLLLLVTLAASGAALAQPGISRLQCDGKYSHPESNTKDAENQGGYVEIRGREVKVIGITGFGGTYASTYRDEVTLCFELPADKLIRGCLNRFSGALSFTQTSSTSNRATALWYGRCKPAKPLF